MLIKTLYTNRNFNKSKLNNVYIQLSQNYSRRSNNDESSYKVVSPKKPKGVATNLYLDPNINILTYSKGHPFFLPGNIGPAWQNKFSTLQTHNYITMKFVPTTRHGPMTCEIQECPRVLRQSVYELFPYTSLEHVQLAVVTLSIKFQLKTLRGNKDLETEKMAQTFVLAAYNICQKLRDAGYWADFINPFSGLPYLQPLHTTELYTTDEKFRCLDFQIFSINDCKIITNEEDKRSPKKFVGSLFTTAPANKRDLDTVFVDKNS